MTLRVQAQGRTLFDFISSHSNWPSQFFSVKKFHKPCYEGRLIEKSVHDMQNVDMAENNVPSSADTHISHASALEYWSSTSATVDGMLGGYPQVSRIDLQGSRTFLAKLRRKQAGLSTQSRGAQLPLLERVVDCGAGIGRITKGLLLDVAQCVDVVEPVIKFTNTLVEETSRDRKDSGSRIGDIYNLGLESFTPSHSYDLIWNQWCLGQLNDEQVVSWLRRSGSCLKPNGWIVVKENVLGPSYEKEGIDLYDEVDSSVTRRLTKWRDLFKRADMKIIGEELQKGFVKELFPVRMWALRPV